MSTSTLRAWLEVDGRRLRANFRSIRDGLDRSVRVIPMVKADGYGLGVLEVIRALAPERPWGWGVATVDEGVQLREHGVDAPVIILSPLPPDAHEAAVERGLSITVGDAEGLGALRGAVERRNTPARFHLEIDTGMGRAGLDWRRAAECRDAVQAAAASPLLTWEGLFTHFHSADEPGGPGVEEQWSRFSEAVSALEGAQAPELLHVCNSAAALRRPEMGGGAVRSGIFLYGGGVGADLPRPEPVASLRARVTMIRRVVEGTSLGYGVTYRARGDEVWATVGIGYGDGLPRLLSNRGRALVRGRPVPIIGRISMDMTVVDISDVGGVELGETVTFFGVDGEAALGVDEVAGTADTISYELLAGVTPRVPRIWIHE